MEERITSMIPRYGKLNKIYAEIISGGSFSFEKQQFISDFYREYGDTQTFETALISLMLEALKLIWLVMKLKALLVCR